MRTPCVAASGCPENGGRMGERQVPLLLLRPSSSLFFGCQRGTRFFSPPPPPPSWSSAQGGLLKVYLQLPPSQRLQKNRQLPDRQERMRREEGPTAPQVARKLGLPPPPYLRSPEFARAEKEKRKKKKKGRKTFFPVNRQKRENPLD